MKATLYRLPGRYALVLRDDDGKESVQYPLSETRARQAAQDAGAPKVACVDGIDPLLYKGKPKPVTMV